jgi:hypothetical protein
MDTMNLITIKFIIKISFIEFQNIYELMVIHETILIV